jgi:hypothetical protein
VIRRRLGAGARCLVAEVGGRFAGYIWLQTGQYEEDEVRCTFEPWPANRVCWDFDVYVVPSYRGTRTFGRLWTAAGAMLSTEGFTHSASRISAFNVQSQRAHSRAGARVVGSATFVVAGKRQWMLAWCGGRPNCALTKDRRPIIRASLPEKRGNARPRAED